MNLLPQIISNIQYDCSYIYTLISYTYKIYKTLHLRKGVEITIKSKETSSQFEPVRNSYVTTLYQPVPVSSNMRTNACTNKAFSSISTRFNPTLAGIEYMSDNTSLNLVDVLESALFVHAFSYMFELTVTGWCIIAT